MSVYVKSRGGEVVLLPGSTVSIMGNPDVRVGPHTVVVSGIVRLPGYLRSWDDDSTARWKVYIDIQEVIWEPTFLQASSLVTWGEIYSDDSDEVDHSRWAIEDVTTGHVDVPYGGRVVRTLRLYADLGVQGEGNTFERIGFHVVANGTLLDTNQTRRIINETREIGSRQMLPPAPQTREASSASEGDAAPRES